MRSTSSNKYEQFQYSRPSIKAKSIGVTGVHSTQLMNREVLTDTQLASQEIQFASKFIKEVLCGNLYGIQSVSK